MANYTTVKNQSIIGLAVQLYGNVDAFRELLELNDLAGKMHQSLALGAEEVDLAFSLLPGTTITYDDESELRDERALADMNGRVIVDGLEKKRIYSKQYSKEYA